VGRNSNNPLLIERSGPNPEKTQCTHRRKRVCHRGGEMAVVGDGPPVAKAIRCPPASLGFFRCWRAKWEFISSDWSAHWTEQKVVANAAFFSPKPLVLLPHVGSPQAGKV
jgi:hypothetical protein